MKTRALLLLIAVMTLTACQSANTVIPVPGTETTPVGGGVGLNLTASPTLLSDPTASPTETPLPVPTPTTEPVEIFTRDSDEPIVFSGENSKFTDPGAIVWHDGLFHMFNNSFNQWPGKVSWMYTTSADGLTWTGIQETPIFTSDQVPYTNSSAAASNVYVTDDGIWVIYFFTYDGRGTKSYIGRATAANPLGPWNVDPEPVIAPGSSGAWDEAQTWRPTLVILEDEMRIYYTGVDDAGFMNLGMASSTDGINWMKHNDLSTTDSLFVESDPVMVSTEQDGWEYWGPSQPEIVLTPNGWVMFYRSFDRSTRLNFGLAFSDDGVTWKKHANPISVRADQPNRRSIYQTQLQYINGMYLLYLEIGSGKGTDVFLATHEGALLFQEK